MNTVAAPTRDPMYLPQPDTQEDRDVRFQMDCEQASGVCRELRRVKGLTRGGLETIVHNLITLIGNSPLDNREMLVAQLTDFAECIQ